MMAALTLTLCLASAISLALAKPRHWRQATDIAAPGHLPALLTLTGIGLVLAALPVAIAGSVDALSGLALWAGALALAGTAVALIAAARPRWLGLQLPLITLAAGSAQGWFLLALA
jgi:hypothetical protein